MQDRWRVVSETHLAGVKSRVSAKQTLRQGPPFLRDSNRHMSRVEHGATYRKQRTGCTSTRHSRERAEMELTRAGTQ